MQHMERNYKVDRSMMKLRNMVLIGNMYLLGLRVCDLYMINEDQVELDQVERAVGIKLKGGKLTKMKVKHGRILANGHSEEYFEYIQLWIWL